MNRHNAETRHFRMLTSIAVSYTHLTVPVWMSKFEIADLFGVFSCDVRLSLIHI